MLGMSISCCLSRICSHTVPNGKAVAGEKWALDNNALVSARRNARIRGLDQRFEGLGQCNALR